MPLCTYYLFILNYLIYFLRGQVRRFVTPLHPSFDCTIGHGTSVDIYLLRRGYSEEGRRGGSFMLVFFFFLGRTYSTTRVCTVQ